MTKEVQPENLKIKTLNKTLIKKILRDQTLFAKFLKLNKGFVDDAILSTIGRNKKHPDYEDFYQIGCIGLYKALKKFNTGASFSTFAYVVIQNDIRQEIKKLNKQKNIDRDKLSGEYVYREISMERLRRNFSNGADDQGDYKESIFTNTPSMNHLRNFENEILDKITIEKRMQQWTNIEKEIIRLKFFEGLSLRALTIELQKKFRGQSLSFGTIRNIFYTKLKSQFENLQKEIS